MEAVALGEGQLDPTMDDEELSFTSLARKAKHEVDLKTTLEDTAKVKARAAQRAADLESEGPIKEEEGKAKIEAEGSAETKKEGEAQTLSQAETSDAPKKDTATSSGNGESQDADNKKA